MNIKYDDKGLVPAVVQDVNTKEVLMLAYMNEESVNLTLETKLATYYSRSRKELWVKGKTSGNLQYVKNFSLDCDSDTILLQVEQVGVACHTNAYSCFFNKIVETTKTPFSLYDLYALIKERKVKRPEGSYTTYLFDKGVDKILKKVAEETGEVIIASKNNNDEVIYETSDLLYHLIVLLVELDIPFESIIKELDSRR